jgi:hypothetical protein
MRVLHWWMERTSLTEQVEFVCHIQRRPYVMSRRPYVMDKGVRQGNGLGIWPRTWGPLLGPCSGRQCGRHGPRVINKMGYQTVDWDYSTYCSAMLGCPNEPDTPGRDSCVHELWQSQTGHRCIVGVCQVDVRTVWEYVVVVGVGFKTFRWSEEVALRWWCTTTHIVGVMVP